MLRYLLILLISFNVLAEEFTYKIAIPENSQLSPIKSEYGVLFNGTTDINVTYQFHYDEFDKYGRGNISLYVYPDTSSLKSLPYLLERGRPEKANQIFILNPEKSFYFLLSSEQTSQLLSGMVRSFSGKAKLQISSFFASYSCDSPSFTAEFVQLKKEISIASNQIKIESTGC